METHVTNAHGRHTIDQLEIGDLFLLRFGRVWRPSTGPPGTGIRIVREETDERLMPQVVRGRDDRITWLLICQLRREKVGLVAALRQSRVPRGFLSAGNMHRVEA